MRSEPAGCFRDLWARPGTTGACRADLAEKSDRWAIQQWCQPREGACGRALATAGMSGDRLGWLHGGAGLAASTPWVDFLSALRIYTGSNRVLLRAWTGLLGRGGGNSDRPLPCVRWRSRCARDIEQQACNRDPRRTQCRAARVAGAGRRGRLTLPDRSGSGDWNSYRCGIRIGGLSLT
jgi:hypothetical protein